MNALNLKKQLKHPESKPGSAITLPVHTGEVWLGIHFPDISLMTHQTSKNAPFAVLEQRQGKTRIYRMNKLAQGQGIEPGMPLNAAYALCQSLCVVIRDEMAELNHLQGYARTAMHFTPRIALSRPDTLLLEVKASLHLFDGVKCLYQQLKNIFTVPHIIACAPVADAAELMARHGIEKVIRCADRLQAALGEIMIADTPIEEKLTQQLTRCGLHSLRDVWRLPRPDLARRFGPSLLQYLDQLSGKRIMPRLLFEAKTRFTASYDFDRETNDNRYVLYAAERLLQQAQHFLQTRVSLSEKISFRLIHARRYHDRTRRWITLNVYARQGGDTPAHFLPQFAEQLQRLGQRLELENTLTSLELRIDQFKPRTDITQDLFKNPRPAADSWPVLLDLLFARLGRKHVYRLNVVADHRPEKAWQKKSVQPVISRRQAMPCLPDRPAWLFNLPVKCLGQRFKLISDAERLESGWWEDQDQCREYYQGIGPSGRHCWLYRDLQATNECWYLHGLFA
jgi:protein ImuB